jgi:hypothetical protein
MRFFAFRLRPVLVAGVFVFAFFFPFFFASTTFSATEYGSGEGCGPCRFACCLFAGFFGSPLLR